MSEPSVPSLLRRMALASGGASESSKPAQRESSVPAKRRAEADSAQQQSQKRQHSQRARPLQPGAGPAPEVGFSIKGAAARANQSTAGAVEEQSASLLNRLNQNEQGGGGSSKRRRTKT